jgi:hypothetical protein
MRGLDWKIVLLSAALLGNSCSSGSVENAPAEGAEGEEKNEKKPTEAAVRVAGEIVSVHPEGGFVLIKVFGGGRLPLNEVLTSVDHGGQSSVLKPTGERIGKFHAADVPGRFPAVGDLVIARKLPDSGLQVSPEPLAGAL